MELIYHCRTMYKSRTLGLSTFITLVLGFLAILSLNQVRLLEGKVGKKYPLNEPQRDEPYNVKEPRVVLYRTKWKVNRNAENWINLKSTQNRRLVFWQTNSNAIILDNSVPADCLAKVVHYKTREILHQQIHLSPHPPPKVSLKSVWQVQHESTGKLVADQVTTIPDENFMISTQQGEEGSRKQYIGKHVHVIMFHTNKDALIAELHSSNPYQPFSEESKHMIADTLDIGNYVLWWRCLHFSFGSRRLNKEKYDVLTISLLTM